MSDLLCGNLICSLINVFSKYNKKITTFPVKKMWALGSADEVNLFLKEFDYDKNN